MSEKRKVWTLGDVGMIINGEDDENDAGVFLACDILCDGDRDHYVLIDQETGDTRLANERIALLNAGEAYSALLEATAAAMEQWQESDCSQEYQEASETLRVFLPDNAEEV